MALPLRDDTPTRRFPWITVCLMLANVFVFLMVEPPGFQDPPSRRDPSAEAVARSDERAVFAYRWGAVPCEVLSGSPRIEAPDRCPSPAGAPLPATKSVYLALLTAVFLHQNVLHLAGNLLFLWVFGNNVEDRLGRLGFLAFYLAGGIVSMAGWVAANPDSGVPGIGASGAIAAAMGAYLVLHPRGRILSVVYAGTFQLAYIPAAGVLGLFFVTQFSTPDNGVAWEAHAVGMAAGSVAMLGLSRLPALRRRAAAEAAHAALRPGTPF